MEKDSLNRRLGTLISREPVEQCVLSEEEVGM